jgi:4-oxalocrotonate tautomerase
MPVITVEGPAIRELDKKRTLVKGLTDAAVEAYGIEEIVVLIKENTPDNVGVRGTLIADRKHE